MLSAPLVDARCGVCAAEARAVICSEAEVRSHLEYLQRFHGRRLRSRPGGNPSAEALADRASFTQSYATNIVRCVDCGAIYRHPRPPAEAILRAYAKDRYGRERLEGLFGAQAELYRPKAQRLRKWL